MSPPAATPHKPVRLSPAHGEGVRLEHARYDLRSRDGAHICWVPRDRAEQGLAVGSLELWRGQGGAYLRAVGVPYPTISRKASAGPDSRHTLHGREATAPANPAALYRPNYAACNLWTQLNAEDIERASRQHERRADALAQRNLGRVRDRTAKRIGTAA